MYCNFCGKPLNPGEVCTCQQPQPQQYQPNFYNGGYFTTEPASPAIAILRKHGSSALMLITAILFTVGTILNVINSALTAQSFMNTINMMAGYDALSPEFMTGSTVGSFVGAIFGSVINYIYIGALFSLYSNCRKPIDSYVKTGGLTVFKVFAIINIVSYAFLILILAIFGVAMFALGGELAYELEYLLYDLGIYDIPSMGAAVGAVFGGVFFVLAGVVLFNMFVQIAFIKTLNSLKNTCKTGAPALKISGFFAVMMIITGAANIFMSAFDVFSFITYAIIGASFILGAVLLFKIKKDMKNFVMSTVQPNFAPPAYVPNDGPTAYYYNPQQPEYTAPVEPAYEEAPVAEPVYEEIPAAEPVIEPIAEPVIEEAPVFEMPEVVAEEVPEIEVPAEEPTAEPVAEVAEELVNEPVVPAEVICPNCGKAYSPAANFCVSCGTPNPNK